MVVTNMAAGRVDVPRRREYSAYGYFRKDEGEVGHYRNDIRDAKSGRVGRGYQSTNGRRSSADERKLGSRRGEPRSDDVPCLENGGVSKREDEVQMPPEKKRKFSPIIWDLEDKEVRISSKNRLIPTNSFSCSKFADGSVEEKSAADSVGAAAKELDKESGVEGLEHKSEEFIMACDSVEGGSAVLCSPVGFSVSLPQEENRVDGTYQVQLDEEHDQSRSIMASRWASDSDSPLSDGGASERGQSLRSSTPESGEFRRESSEDSAGSSRSGELGVARSSSYSGSEFEDDEMGVDNSSDNNVVPERKSMLNGCRCLSEFERLNKISEGTYGIVHRARDKVTDEVVALKEVKMNVGSGADEFGFPISSLREINILLSFNHPSIVNVKEVVMHDSNLNKVFMVMEYMEHDLNGLMESMKQPFSTSEVKCLMLQLLEGVKYLHDNWVIHRDLKTSNLLVNNQGELKICDFGMSRQYGSPLKSYTTLVVTLWYR